MAGGNSMAADGSRPARPGATSGSHICACGGGGGGLPSNYHQPCSTCVTRNPYCHSKSIKYLVGSAFAAQFAANDSANSIVLTSTHPQHEHASLSVHALSLPHPAPFPFRSLESGAHHPCHHHASRALQHSASLWRAGSANMLIRRECQRSQRPPPPPPPPT